VSAVASKRIWTYEEALAHFPVVRDLTRQAVQQVEALFNRVQSREEMEERREEIETSYQNIVAAWADEGLGRWAAWSRACGWWTGTAATATTAGSTPRKPSPTSTLTKTVSPAGFRSPSCG
jgi:hypothetical protein